MSSNLYSNYFSFFGVSIVCKLFKLSSNLYSDYFSFFGVSVVSKLFILQTQCALPPFLLGERLSFLPNVLKKEELDRSSIFRGGLLGKREVTFLLGGLQFYIENKLKSEIFNDKKSL